MLGSFYRRGHRGRARGLSPPPKRFWGGRSPPPSQGGGTPPLKIRLKEVTVNSPQWLYKKVFFTFFLIPVVIHQSILFFNLKLLCITTERVINIFLEQGPRWLRFNPKSSAVNSNGGNNIPYSIFYSIIILINFLLGLIFSTLVQNLLKDYVDINIKLFKFHS